MALRTLRELTDCENDCTPTQFCFTVPLHRCSPMTPEYFRVVDLSLAIYNDLKLSQYILEQDHNSTRDERHFMVTPLGRSVAACTSRGAN